MTTKSNYWLAEAYSKRLAMEAVDATLIKRHKGRITDCEADIEGYFVKRGSLDGFKYKGIGPKTLSDLTNILKEKHDRLEESA